MKENQEYSNSELCQSCGKCCQKWWFYTDCKDDAVRAGWLDTNKISIIKVKEGLWKIVFNIPCKKLTRQDGKWICTHHKGFRPQYCREYPANFLNSDLEILELEKKTCQALRELHQR